MDKDFLVQHIRFSARFSILVCFFVLLHLVEKEGWPRRDSQGKWGNTGSDSSDRAFGPAARSDWSGGYQQSMLIGHGLKEVISYAYPK
jgi:hypothetical protein